MNGEPNRTAIVTGASGGIGRAIADELRRSGFLVFGMDVEAPDHVDWQHVHADVSDEASVHAAIEEIVSTVASIDVLVNNAGVLIMGFLSDMPVEHFDRQLAVNVRGPFLVAQKVVPYMPAGARIINLASELAYLGRAEHSAYCASKGAIISMTRSWARELAPRILVNAVAPGPVDTPLLQFDQLTDEQKELELQNLLGRIGRPEEVAHVVSFLAGERSSFITGQCISVDAGAAMH
ncbi:MAG: SDR family oxidoreductase [bacterium]|nr:SDR family oxidoreductase [bacterium]